MALRKKPIEAPAASERDIERVIEKGGAVSSERNHKRRKQSNFPLRFLQDDMPGRINAALSRRPLKPSMNMWINEAILDKLKAEEG
jgi:hypothetical protein